MPYSRDSQAYNSSVSDTDMTFSPSDLTAYLECQHLARLEVEVKRGERTRPVVENLHAKLIGAKGAEHEAAYLAQLTAEGRDVVRIELGDEWDWERAARETEEALRAGREVIYQATFVDDPWRGLAAFVVRQSDGTYEAVDT